MKVYFYLLAFILLLQFISKTNEDLCPTGKISISPLGKCKSITEFLEDESLTIKTENLMYLASNNEGKIEKDNYILEIFKLNDTKLQSHKMRKSKLYIPDSCLDQMENNTDIKLNRDKGIVILVENSNNMNKNNIPDQYFIIRHNSEGSTTKFISSKTFDLSFCHKDPILLEYEIDIDNLRYNDTNDSAIDLDTILYGRKNGIDLFDPYSKFLSDICFKFKSEKGTDVTLDSRLEDYYQNVSFCDDNERSHYLAYNYSAERGTFTYRCAFGYYENDNQKMGYLETIDKQLKSLVSVSNLMVITCYKKFLNIRDIIRNYGGMICILVFLIQLVCFLIFCFCGIKPIEEKLDNLFIVGKSILTNLMRMATMHTTEQNLIDVKPKKFNLWGTIRKIIQRKKEEKLKQEKEKQEKEKQLNMANNNNNPPKKRKSLKHNSLIPEGEDNLIKKSDNDNNDNKENAHKKRKSLKRNSLVPEGEGNIIKIDNDKNDNKENGHKKRKSLKGRKSLNLEGEANLKKVADNNDNKKEHGHKRRKSLKRNSINPEGDVKLNVKDLEETDIINVNNDNNSIKNKDKKEKKEKKVGFKDEVKDGKDLHRKETQADDDKKKKEKKDTDSDTKSQKTQIYDYENDELNELHLKRALKYDKRSFCKYYWNILMFSHIILNVFFRHNDYNLFAVKLGLLFMTFPINLTFNIFFYTSKQIKVNYANALDDISGFWKSISNSIYSSLLSSTLLIMLKFICLTHNSVRVLRKFKDIDAAKTKSVCVLRCIKIRVTIYYILSLAFLAIFGYYILCFCAIFENTQIQLIKSTFTSWLISLIYPLIICLVTSIFRKLAFKFKNRILYAIKQLMQFL